MLPEVPAPPTSFSDPFPSLYDYGLIGNLHTAARCHVDRAAPGMREIFERTIEIYGRQRFRGGR